MVDPFSSGDGKPPLKIGQFVNANIQGRTVENAMVVPNKALREGSYVFVSQDQRLERRPVSVVWQDDQNALVESGLNTGDLVVTTSLNSTLAGARVKLSDSFATEPAEALAENLESRDIAESAENSPESDQNQAASAPTESDSTAIIAPPKSQLEQSEQTLEQQFEDVISENPIALPDEADDGQQFTDPTSGEEPSTEQEQAPSAKQAQEPSAVQNQAPSAPDQEPAALKQAESNETVAEPLDESASQNELGNASDGGNAAIQN